MYHENYHFTSFFSQKASTLNSYFARVLGVVLLLISISLKGQKNIQSDLSILYKAGVSSVIQSNPQPIDSQDPLFAQGAEFKVDIHLASRFGLLFGVGFHTYARRYFWPEAKFSDPSDPIFGQLRPVQYEVREHKGFLAIPTMLRYSILQKEESSLEVQLGTRLNLQIMNHQTRIKSDDAGNRQETSSTTWRYTDELMFTGSFAVLYAFDISPKLKLIIGPEVEVSLIDTYTILSYNTYPYRASLSIGVGF